MKLDKNMGLGEAHSLVAEILVQTATDQKDLCPCLISHGAHADEHLQTLSGYSLVIPYALVRGQEKACGPM